MHDLVKEARGSFAERRPASELIVLMADEIERLVAEDIESAKVIGRLNGGEELQEIMGMHNDAVAEIARLKGIHSDSVKAVQDHFDAKVVQTQAGGKAMMPYLLRSAFDVGVSYAKRGLEVSETMVSAEIDCQTKYAVDALFPSESGRANEGEGVPESPMGSADYAEKHGDVGRPSLPERK